VIKYIVVQSIVRCLRTTYMLFAYIQPRRVMAVTTRRAWQPLHLRPSYGKSTWTHTSPNRSPTNAATATCQGLN